MEPFEEILRDLMQQNNLSQDKIAKEIGVSQKAISNWLNGNDTPKASSLIAIYNRFGITPNELLGIEETKYTPKRKPIKFNIQGEIEK